MTGLRSAVEYDGSRGAVLGIFLSGSKAPWIDEWGEYSTWTAPVDVVAKIFHQLTLRPKVKVLT